MDRFKSISLVLVFLTLIFTAGCESWPKLKKEGKAAYDQQAYELAVQKYEAVIKQRPQELESMVYLGKSYLKLGDIDPALRHLALAVELVEKEQINSRDKLGLEALELYAVALKEDGQTIAMVNYLNGLKERYKEPVDYLRKAKLMELIGDMDNALSEYQLAVWITEQHWAKLNDRIKLKPRQIDLTSFYALADFYQRTNKLDKTRETLRRAYYYEPKNDIVIRKLKTLQVPINDQTAIDPEPFKVPPSE